MPLFSLSRDGFFSPFVVVVLASAQLSRAHLSPSLVFSCSRSRFSFPPPKPKNRN